MRDRRSIPQGLYTDDEIRASYRQAQNKRQQIKILADLNCCEVDDIKNILGVHEAPDTDKKAESERKRKRMSPSANRSKPTAG